MSRFIPIDVRAYAGFKADEAPRAFLRQGRWLAIEEVLDRWYQAARDPALPSADYFKVRTVDGGVFIIRRDNKSLAWSLQVEDTAG